MSTILIRAAFESRLYTWASTRSVPLPVAWQNVSFTPPVGKIYLSAALIPAPTGSQDLEGKHRQYMGLFQVNVVGPAGVGSGHVGEVAEELETLFPLNLRLSTTAGDVIVYEPMSQSPPLLDNGTFTIPVWCQYRMDTI